MELNDRKLCTRCRHCVAHPELLKTGESRLEQYQCFHPNNIVNYEPVDGSPVFRNHLCVYHRSQGAAMTNYCRVEGAWFEPKPIVYEPNTVPANPTPKQVLKIKIGTDLLTDLGL